MKRSPLLSAACRQQLQCVGCAGQRYWSSTGILLVMVGTRWYWLVIIGNVGKGVGSVGAARHRRAEWQNTTSIASHDPYLACGRWKGPCNRRQGPAQRRERIEPTYYRPGVGDSGLALYPTGSGSISRIAPTSGGTITRRTTFGQRSTGGAANSSFDSVTT